jgi:hypothetical protein
MEAFIISAAIANALVCGWSLWRGQRMAAGATGLGFSAMALILVSHWG